MSDNEGFESQTDTKGSTDSEDIAEQSSVVQPYQFEPVADSDNKKHTKTAFFVKLLRRDSKQDVSKYARAFFNIYTGGAKAPPAPMLAPPLKGFGPPSKSPFWSEN